MPTTRWAWSTAQGRVRGVAGLRVIDASIMPDSVRANIHATVLAMAWLMGGRMPRDGRRRRMTSDVDARARPPSRRPSRPGRRGRPCSRCATSHARSAPPRRSRDVSIALHGGEIHALLGENGAGKSTLIKIMTGVQQPDTGEMLIDGRAGRGSPSLPGRPAAGRRRDLPGADDLPGPVGRGEHLHRPPRPRPRRGPAPHAARGARRCWRAWTSASTSSEPARGLTLAQQQTVEIAKAISLNVRVLIMDEPTASLSAHEVHQLFRIVATLRRQGVAVLFISHRMEEVFEIADRVTILRDGRWISTTPRGELTPAAAIRDMVGSAMVRSCSRDSQSHPGEVLLEVQGLRREGAFEDVSFELRAGEVLGFAGLVGARRTDVGLALFGIAPADGGHDPCWTARRSRSASPQEAPCAGHRLHHRGPPPARPRVPAVDRGQHLAAVAASAILTGCGLMRRTDGARSAAERFRERLRIRAPSVDTRASRPVRRQPAEGRAQQVAGDAAARARSWTSRPAASTWAPRWRSTSSSTSWPRRAWPSSSSAPTCPRCWP